MPDPVLIDCSNVDSATAEFVRESIGRVTHIDTIVQSRLGEFAAIVRPGGTSDAASARILVGDGDSVRTMHRGPATALAWSDDGRRLAFATPGSTGSELRLWDESVGDSAVIPAVAPGVVEQMMWRGGELVILVAPLGADAAVGSGAARYPDAGTVHHRRPGEGARTLAVIGSDLRTTVSIDTDLGTIWEFDLAPDNGFVVIASDDPTESGWYSARLVAIQSDGGRTRTIHRSAWQLSCPKVNPSGDGIALIEGWASDRGFLAGNVITVDFDGTPTGSILPRGGPDVTTIQWRDGETIWFSGWTGMRSVHGWASLDGRASDELSVDEGVALARIGFPLDPDAALFGSAQEVNGEVTLAVARSRSGGWEALDDPETPRWGVTHTRRVSVDQVSWLSGDGLVVEGAFIRSLNRTGPLPLVVHIHGGPAGLWHATADASAIILAEAGFAVLRPNPRGSIGRGQGFATANLGDPGGGELQDLTSGIAFCIDQGWAAPSAVFATGGSYGGYLTSCLAVFTDSLTAAAVASGHPDLVSARYGSNNPAFYDRLLGGAPTRSTTQLWAERSPVLAVTDQAAPTLILHGEADRCTPVGQAEELYRALTDATIDSAIALYPGEGHGFRDLDNLVDYWCRIIGWFRCHIETNI